MRAKTIQTIACPGCGSTRGSETETAQVYRCAKCGAVHGTCYKGDASRFVLLQFAREAVPAEVLRYFDLTLLGSQGIERTHGWYDPATKLVHQFG